MTDYRPRELSARIANGLRRLPAVVVSGPRQIGKSTLLLKETAFAGRYLHLLETLFLARRLPPFLKNRSSRLIKSPKLFYTDSGLACHLAGVREMTSPADAPLKGAMFETYVVQNIAAILEAHEPEAKLSYWHEQGRHEVDLVIEAGRRVVAAEIKAATRWTKADVAGLQAFLDRTPQCVAAVLACNGTKTVQLNPKMWAVPIGALLA